MTTQTNYRVFVIESAEEFGTPVHVGFAKDKIRAAQLVRNMGYGIAWSDGCIQQYDEEDAPLIYGYKADRSGAISINVTPV